MPGKRSILSIAISSLLIAPTVQAAPKWDCRPGADGGWECFKDGVLVPPEPVTAAKPVPTKPKAQTKPAPEPASTEAVKEPEPEVAEQARPEPIATPRAPEPAATKPAQPAATVAAQPERPEPASTEAVEEPAPEVAEQAKPTQPAAAVAAQPRRPEPEPTAAKESPRPTESEKKRSPSQSTESATLAQIDAQLRIDRGLNWEQCGPHQGFVTTPVEPVQGGRTNISSDGAELLRLEDKALFSGNVEVRQGDQVIEADQIEYNNADDTLVAEGNVFYEQSGLRFAADRSSMNLAQNQGQVENLEYRLLDRAARGSAASGEIQSRDRSSYKEVNYTTCPPGNSDWMLQAAELDVDKASGVGSAREAKLTFKGVPLFYAPSITFPIDDRRKSGFLIPSVGVSDNNGLDISAPYYINIAPNMDATLTPRVMSERGLMLGGEFRYLAERHEGELKAEILPSDSASNEHDKRGAFSYQAKGEPAQNWVFDVDINHVSDDDYLDDLGDSLAVTSTKSLERHADLRYYGNGWNLLGRVQNYQIIDSSLTEDPYDRLPQLLLNLNKPSQAMGLTYHLRTEYVHFDKSDAVTGQRFDLQPGISLPMRNSWGYVTPKLSARYTSYSLDDQTPGLETDPTRTTGSFSLDSGLFFERETSWFGNAITQTLEPRLFYLYTPYEDQSDLPDFDTAELDFSFANLFRENRFSGVDKVGDANQLTLALTSRNLDNATGEELLRASIGQIIYFRDREVQLTGNSGTIHDDSSSALVAEVAARLNQNWRTLAGIQWNPHLDDGNTEKAAFGLHYNDQQNRLFNISYRLSDGDFEQTDLSASWPLSHQWSLVGRWNYSLMDGNTMEAFGGIEYDNCCWAARLVARQHRTDANAEPNLGIFLQLELKGLTSLGDNIEQFLERGILGYQPDK